MVIVEETRASSSAHPRVVVAAAEMGRRCVAAGCRAARRREPHTRGMGVREDVWGGPSPSLSARAGGKQNQ